MEIVRSGEYEYQVFEEGREDCVFNLKDIPFCTVDSVSIITFDQALTTRKFNKHELFFVIEYDAPTDTFCTMAYCNSNHISHFNKMQVVAGRAFIEELYKYFWNNEGKEVIVLNEDFIYIADLKQEVLGHFKTTTFLEQNKSTTNKYQKDCLKTALLGEEVIKNKASGFIILTHSDVNNEREVDYSSILGFAEPIINDSKAIFKVYCKTSLIAYKQVYFLNNYVLYKGEILMDRQLDENYFECGIIPYDMITDYTLIEKDIVLPDYITREWVDCNLDYKSSIGRCESLTSIL